MALSSTDNATAEALHPPSSVRLLL